MTHDFCSSSVISDVPSLAKLQKLTVLDIDHNRLTSLPADLCTLPSGVFSKNNCGLDWGGSDECCMSSNIFRCAARPMPHCAIGCEATCVCDAGDDEERCALSELWFQTNGGYHPA